MLRAVPANRRRRRPDAPPADRLTHVDEKGATRMVDVSGKDKTHRRAVARGGVKLKPKTLRAVLDGEAPKGAVLETARLAGIQAAKRTWELIPLCHPIPLTSVTIDLVPKGRNRIEITAEAVAADRTGVEMEALVAVTTAALTIYDMLKAIERGIVIEETVLLAKEGGRSGRWERGAAR